MYYILYIPIIYDNWLTGANTIIKLKGKYDISQTIMKNKYDVLLESSKLLKIAHKIFIKNAKL